MLPGRLVLYKKHWKRPVSFVCFSYCPICVVRSVCSLGSEQSPEHDEHNVEFKERRHYDWLLSLPRKCHSVTTTHWSKSGSWLRESSCWSHIPVWCCGQTSRESSRWVSPPPAGRSRSAECRMTVACVQRIRRVRKPLRKYSPPADILSVLKKW